MDEVWERAVETALDGQKDCSSARSLTLDGVVKCLHGRLPPPSLLEKLQALEHLSIANIGLSSLDKFPRLLNLQRLILSDNRIAGGLEFLVEAGLASLRDLDLSNNRIQFVEDLAPLAQLKIVSLDLYECPVTRVKDYRSRVFSMIRSLKYLDKMDADENERPESDEEEDEEEDEDPGSGEIDGDGRSGRVSNGRTDESVVDADEDEESDADEEETARNGSERTPPHLANGFRVAAAAANGEDEDEDAEDEEDLGEEIDEDDGEDEDVIEVQEIEDSEEDEDVVEEEEYEDDEDEDDEDVEDDDEDAEEPGSTGRLTSTEGEIDGHDQGEEDENGEIGEEDEQGIEETGEYEDGEGEDEVRFLISSLHSSSAELQLAFAVEWSYGLKNVDS